MFKWLHNRFVSRRRVRVLSRELSEFIDPGKACQVRNQTNVWSFRSGDWTKSAVVGVMYVTNFKSCSFTAKTAGSECRNTTFVGDLAQWVGLIEELGEL